MGKNGGGPAFPLRNTDPNDYIPFPGMTLRDYFAAHAPEMPSWWVRNYPTTDNSMEIFVAWRWFYADAMLAERERKTNATD
jgi:hypothetical protein